MTDISSVASAAVASIAKQTTDLGKAATTSFSDALSKVKSTVTGKPSTGFVSGPTYEANTITGKTKAAFNHTVDATRSALHIGR